MFYLSTIYQLTSTNYNTNMIPFLNRFHGHGSLRFVYKNGRAVRSRNIILKYIANPHRKNSRVAVVVSKKVIKSAVKRNRIRRRVYECVRADMRRFDRSYDIALIVSSAELLAMSFDELSQQISGLLKEAGIAIK